MATIFIEFEELLYMYMYLFLPHSLLCCVCHAPPLQELMLSQAFSAPAIFLIVIGVMLFIIGFCGCFGALLEIFYLLVIVSLTHTLTIATVTLHSIYSLSLLFLSLSLSLFLFSYPPLQYSALLSFVVLVEVALVVYVVLQQDQVCLQ